MADDKIDKERIAQKKKEMNDELSKIAAERDIAAAQAYRARLAANRLAADQDAKAKLHEKGMTTDEHGREITYWDKLMREADRAIHSEQNSYNDWRSAMMSLLSLYSTLVKAASHSLEELVNPYTSQAKQVVRENVLVPLKDKILDTIRGNPRVDLPALIHEVTLNDQNQLDFGTLKRSDDGELKSSAEGAPLVLEPAFQTLVSLWLKEQGYEPAANGTYISTDGNNTILTKDVFNDLKNSPEHGLNKFLEESSGLEFRPSGP